MNTRQPEHRPFADLASPDRLDGMRRRLIKLAWIVIIAFLALLATWLYPKVKALQESRAKDRYEEIHKIVLDGRGPALKKVMREAVKP